MPYVLREWQGGPSDGEYLEWFLPDAMDGFGACQFTPDLDKARRFASVSDALDCWKIQSTVRPFRKDGEPNRPLTRFAVTPVRVDE